MRDLNAPTCTSAAASASVSVSVALRRLPSALLVAVQCRRLQLILWLIKTPLSQTAHFRSKVRSEFCLCIVLNKLLFSSFPN